MNFEGFHASDFEIFTIDGLEERMDAIQQRIQPKFHLIGQELAHHLAAQLGNEMHLHIAKHARRTVNPPKDTWLAIAANKRGYKQHPHFQVGLFDDHVFIWLAYIYEMPNKTEIAKKFLENMNMIQSALSHDGVVSLDHTKKESLALHKVDLQSSLERFRDVKKAEFLIGKHFASDDPLLTNGASFMKVVEDTFDALLPIYKLSLS